MKILKIILLTAVCSFALSACRNATPDHDHEHDHEAVQDHDHEATHDDDHDDDHEAIGANTVVFHKELSDAIDFSVVEATLSPLGNVIHTVSQVQPSQGDETMVVAKADGVVTIADRTLAEGCAVSAGKAICRIDGSATANNNLGAQQQQAKAEYERAKAEYERMKNLRKDKLVLESELANAKAAYENASATYNAMQKGFGQGAQTVTAPRAGYLKQMLVKNGQFVQAGEPIAVITQSRTMQLKAEVPSSYYADLKNISGANIVTKN